MGDPESDLIIDVPNIYSNVKDSWNSQLFKGLSKDGVLPHEAKSILASANGNGFAVMYQLHQRLNPLLISVVLHHYVTPLRYVLKRRNLA